MILFLNSKITQSRWSIAICIVFLAVALTGCTDSQDNSATAPAGESPAKELVIAYGLDTNAEAARGGSDMLLEIMTTERLVELEGTRVVPSLAESWDILDNGKTIVFHLRKAVRFSDGTPFNADAVKFTYERLMELNSTSWTEIDRVEKIEILDPYTVAFYYKAGMQGYIAITAFGEYHFSILSPTSVEPNGDPSAAIVRFTGTGPWQVADYKRDQYTVFTPNNYYLKQKPGLSKITVKTIPRAEGRVLALQSGDADLVVDYYHGGSAYTPRNMLRTLQNQGFQVLKKEMPMTMVVAFNYTQTPWNIPKVRQAINCAVNKDDISALFDGWITPAKETPFSTTAPYMDDAGVIMPRFDKQKAERLLKEAKFPFKREVSLIVQGQNPDEVKLCELVKAQLADVGLNVRLDVLESGVYSDRVMKGAYDLYIWYAAGPERRKFTRMDGRFNPEAPEFQGSGCFSDPEITAVLKSAVGSFDEEKRRSAFHRFYELLNDRAAVVPLYFDAVFVVARPDVRGIEFVSSEPRFNRVTIKEK